MEKYKILLLCSLVSAVCFAIVSYGYFYRQNYSLCMIYSLLTFTQAFIAYSNYRRLKKDNII
ncbi:MAG: hypothetical protein ACI4P1_07280 [Erysipelotrichaceae bacterium]